jgi:hypothetical protein
VRRDGRRSDASQVTEFEPLAEGVQAATSAEWMGRPLWELWAQGKVYQFYIMQWALQLPERGELKAVVRFILRLSHLADIDSAASEQILAALRSDLAASPSGEAIAANALRSMRPAMSKLFAATRRTPYDLGAFTVHLAPLLAEVPAADTTADEFLTNKDWGFNLCRAVAIISRPKAQESFATAVKPLLIGIGGYGLVHLAFDDKWGTAVALKRQNMAMVMEKSSQAARVLLELKIASTIFSPFILDCPYAYIDDKDLVLALRMLPGGDLAHYIKEFKDKAKKAKLPKTALPHDAARFYLASTNLALEVLHSHGFVYRDLKDKNVLLDADGTARLCDFGLVHDMSEGPATGKVGTKAFWA